MIRCLTLKEALDLHRLMLQQSRGLDGVRDLGGLPDPSIVTSSSTGSNRTFSAGRAKQPTVHADDGAPNSTFSSRGSIQSRSRGL